MLCQFGQKQEPKSSEALRSVACKRPRTGSLPAPCFGSLWLHLAIVFECQDIGFQFMRLGVTVGGFQALGFGSVLIGMQRGQFGYVTGEVLLQILWNYRWGCGKV